MGRGARRTLRPRNGSHGGRGALASLGVLVLVACGSAHTTERVFTGRTERGPYIEPEAYAAFAEGVYLEEQSDRDGALRAFRRAQSRDPDSPGIATRIGALLCRSDPAAALEELETSGIAREYAPAWAVRAACLHRQGNPDEALEAARRAVRLDPQNAAANLLTARLLRERAEPDRAGAWLFGWLLSDPGASASWRAITEEAALSGDASLGELARELGPLSDAGAHAEPAGPEAERPMTLATRAAQHGQLALALEQAELALAADPRDADALVVALYAAALVGDEAALTRVLESTRGTTAPSPELAPLLEHVLRLRVGDEAAERWLVAYRRLAAAAASPR
jgi:tetratricopeptide (TPR) repeat protein